MSKKKPIVWMPSGYLRWLRIAPKTQGVQPLMFLQQRFDCSDGSHEWRNIPVVEIKSEDTTIKVVDGKTEIEYEVTDAKETEN